MPSRMPRMVSPGARGSPTSQAGKRCSLDLCVGQGMYRLSVVSSNETHVDLSQLGLLYRPLKYALTCCCCRGCARFNHVVIHQAFGDAIELLQNRCACLNFHLQFAVYVNDRFKAVPGERSTAQQLYPSGAGCRYITISALFLSYIFESSGLELRVKQRVPTCLQQVHPSLA